MAREYPETHQEEATMISIPELPLIVDKTTDAIMEEFGYLNRDIAMPPSVQELREIIRAILESLVAVQDAVEALPKKAAEAETVAETAKVKGETPVTQPVNVAYAEAETALRTAYVKYVFAIEAEAAAIANTETDSAADVNATARTAYFARVAEAAKVVYIAAIRTMRLAAEAAYDAEDEAKRSTAMERIDGITDEHLGAEATEEDVEQFKAACWAYIERTGATEEEAMDYIWNDGNFCGRIDAELGSKG